MKQNAKKHLKTNVSEQRLGTFVVPFVKDFSLYQSLILEAVALEWWLAQKVVLPRKLTHKHYQEASSFFMGHKIVSIFLVLYIAALSYALLKTFFVAVLLR